MDEHRHIWCLHPSEIVVGHLRWAHCRCGVSVVGSRGLARVDREAYDDYVDPNGVQRRFLAAAGLPPSRR